MQSLVIKISHLTKVYKLYDKSIDRLGEPLNLLNKKYYEDFYGINNVELSK